VKPLSRAIGAVNPGWWFAYLDFFFVRSQAEVENW
jgi:hypothetical protein